jgi:site-specific DNA-methyltransferase (adenine-specific)
MITKEYVKLTAKEIKPYEKNARKNDAAVKSVMQSIEQCEYIAPICVDENNIILAGHTRFKALKRLKYSEIEVCRVNGLTDEQKRKYRLLDNKTTELAEWDFDLLQEELTDLDFGDLQLDWGIEIEEEPKEIIEDEAPEIDEESEPISKLGDIWKLGRHRLMCGDSTNKEMVTKLMNGVQADMYLTDPPYNVDYEGKTKDHLKIQNDKMEDDTFLDFLVNAFETANEHLKPGGVFYIWHADSEGFNFRYACKKVGWTVRQCLIWNKNVLVMGRQDYQWKHEPCLYGWKDGAGHYWASDRKQTTVIDWDKPSRSDLHPTMKPVGLFDYQIKNNTNKGEIVLDSFNGSGTTIIACEQNGRTGYAIELDPRYVDATIKRWETLTGQKAELVNE